ncbi:maleylpyruvate isomerase family mycothiol-dependent enzyme [Streptomyces roseirectus]|uniref:Maleylpyruvate isomerase family mycothiol-dependent enzyme n=1 Tax=Streptomyces roseirectus TaxID=2768066 RepID=A0A7H0IKN5_9ACTN|nr:maleylpyruvate isomerase family mycothiol-dependent enzyme [Streptomyces roseirectus]QNP73351.1 maleylpyruvate isomerase family mycothiol-dependent enzyme [Streptomyces roseirectus]
MTDHVRDLARVRDATERLLNAVAGLDNASVAEPSRLPGWSRGHVLAHLARNADALVNVLAGRPMYATAEIRDADIERDAPRALGVHLADLRASGARFLAAGTEPADWSRTVTLRGSVTDRADRVPFRRWTEVELHHVDLGIGYGLKDLPEEFTTREIAFLADRYDGLDAVPPTRLTDGTHAWRTGRAADVPEVTVSGSGAELLGWLAGRGGEAEPVADGGPLPTLPPL